MIAFYYDLFIFTQSTFYNNVISNPNQKLLPGQFTKVKLLLDVRERAIVVPRKAISIEKGGAFIYVVRRDNVAEKRFVQTGPGEVSGSDWKVQHAPRMFQSADQQSDRQNPLSL